MTHTGSPSSLTTTLRPVMRCAMTLSVFLPFALCLFMSSCQPRTPEADGENISTEIKDTVASQNIKPADTGYANVNGLKMYYEVYGEGKPIVLLHGSFMTIPLNWSHIIPLMAKDRKVIVAE